MPLKDLEKAEVTCLVDNSADILLPNTQLAYRPSLGENWFERSPPVIFYPKAYTCDMCIVQSKAIHIHKGET
jgi:hypothetical protein